MPAPPLPLDKYGRPPSMNFFELFIGTAPRMKKSSYRIKAKAKRHTVSSASLQPAPVIEAPAPEAPVTEALAPAVVIEAPTSEAPVVQAPVDEPPVEEAPAIQVPDPNAANTTYEEVVTFTTLEDHALVGMKLQNMSWTEISNAMPDKGMDALKQRYQQLYEAVHGNTVIGGEGSSSRNETQPKSILKNRKVQIQDNSGSDSDNSDYDSFIDPAPPPFRPVRQDRPQIYINPNEYVMLSKLTEKNDAGKWLEIASRFFDKTGKRVPPDVLKEAMSGIEGGD